ncbi:MAG TPA: O-antigen ligase family protein [bacterium]|nr:O-antigen ligase family protein [bacterium]
MARPVTRAAPVEPDQQAVRPDTPRHADDGAPPPFHAAVGEVLDWIVLLGALALLAWTVAMGLTFLPAAGFLTHRVPLLVFEQASLAVGGAAGIRWLFGGRALPGAPVAALAAVAGVCLLSLGHTTNLYATREEIFLILALAMFAFGLLIVLGDAVKTQAFLAGLVLIAFWEALQGLGQFRAGTATPAYWLSPSFAGLIHTRVYGTLASPNVLAGFLLFGIAGAALLAMSLPVFLRPIAAAVLTGEVIALMLTYSRGGYAGLAAFVVVAAVTLIPVRARAWWVLALIAVLAVVALARLPAVAVRAQSLAPAQEDTATSRRFIWRAAGRVWADHRVWGTGLGTFNIVYSAYRPPDVLATYAILPVPGSAHDDYLQVLAETGAVGAGVFAAALLWGVWRAALRYRCGDTDDRLWIGAGVAAAAGIGVTSLVDENLYVVSNLVMLVALAAVVAAYVTRRARPRLRLWKRLFVLPAGVVVAALPPLLAPPVVATVLHNEATAEVAALRFTDAVATFRAARPLDPLNGVIPAYMGDLAADLYRRRLTTALGPWQSMRDVAAGLYEQAIAANAWDPYPWAELGRLRRDEHRYPDAIAAFREAIRRDAYTPRYRLWLADVLRITGDRDGARREYEEAARLYPVELVMIVHHEGQSDRYAVSKAQLDEVERALTQLGRAP